MRISLPSSHTIKLCRLIVSSLHHQTLAHSKKVDRSGGSKGRDRAKTSKPFEKIKLRVRGLIIIGYKIHRFYNSLVYDNSFGLSSQKNESCMNILCRWLVQYPPLVLGVPSPQRTMTTTMMIFFEIQLGSSDIFLYGIRMVCPTCSSFSILTVLSMIE